MAEADGLQDITNVDSTPLPAGEARRAGLGVSVGETLRAAREAAGLDLKQLAQRTRVTLRHLQALEDGDYAALPGRPYALGFAKSYANAVGLDDKAITEAVRAELAQRAPAPPPRVINQFEVGDPAKTPSRLTIWLAAGMVLAIALAGLVFWRSYYLPSAELPALVGPEQPAAPSSQVAVVPLPAATPNGPVVFTATEDRIWVKFYDGQGQQILQKELAKGEAFTVPSGAQDPKLWTGRPDALAITVGGRPVPRIAEKEGIVKDVPVSAAALLGRGAARAQTPTANLTPPVSASSNASGSSSAASAAPRPRRAVVQQPVPAPAAIPVADIQPADPVDSAPASTRMN